MPIFQNKSVSPEAIEYKWSNLGTILMIIFLKPVMVMNNKANKIYKEKVKKKTERKRKLTNNKINV